jgi:hypothetical protein
MRDSELIHTDGRDDGMLGEVDDEQEAAAPRAQREQYGSGEYIYVITQASKLV